MAGTFGTDGKNSHIPRILIPKENESWDDNGFMENTSYNSFIFTFYIFKIKQLLTPFTFIF